MIKDPSIDAVYIALPNGLHYEWALRSLEAGKHVLLEKPCTSNAIEAKKLFLSPLATGSDAPVLLEAFHYLFHPAFYAFLDEIRRAGKVKHVSCDFLITAGIVPTDDIRYQFSLAGGCMMDAGTYTLSCVRQVLGQDQIEPVDVTYHTLAPGKGRILDPQIDKEIEVSLRTAGGKTANIRADMRSTFEFPSFLPKWLRLNLPRYESPRCDVTLEEETIDAPARTDSTKHFVQKTVTMFNFIIPTFYHRIDVSQSHRIVKDGETVKQWKETKYVKSYNWPAGDGRADAYEDWWTSYRCQLEEFINRIKGRKGSGVWVDAQESITQMEAIDKIYENAGLNIRPHSHYDVSS